MESIASCNSVAAPLPSAAFYRRYHRLLADPIAAALVADSVSPAARSRRLLGFVYAKCD